MVGRNDVNRKEINMDGGFSVDENGRAPNMDGWDTVFLFGAVLELAVVGHPPRAYGPWDEHHGKGPN
jgi:hypothetical protein